MTEVWQCDVQETINGAVATAAVWVGVALAAVSTAVTVASAMSQGSAQSSASNYNATLANNNAAAAQQQAAQNAQIQQMQARQQISAVVANAGGSGIDSGSGSPLDVLASSASSAELDRRTILYKGELQGLGYQDEAALDSAAARNQAAGGSLAAVGAAVAGGSKIAAQFAGPTGQNNTAGNPLSLANNTPTAATLLTPD